MDGSPVTGEGAIAPTSSGDYERIIEQLALEALDEAFDPEPGGGLRTRFAEKLKAKVRALSMMRDADVAIAEELGEAKARTKLVASLAKVTLATEEHRAAQLEQLAAASSTPRAVVPERPLPAITPFVCMSPEGRELKADHCPQCAAAISFAQESAEVIGSHIRAGIVEVGLRVRDGASLNICPSVVGLILAASIGRAAGHHVALQAIRNEVDPFTTNRMRLVALHALDDASARVLVLTAPGAASPPPVPAPTVPDPKAN